MGILIWTTEKLDSMEQQDAINNYFKRQMYTNKYAVENVIRDIIRQRVCEKQTADLIGYGAHGCGNGLGGYGLTKEFLCIQNVYGIERRKGRRMHHEIFSLLDEELEPFKYNMNILYSFAMECAYYYYSLGFQVVFALHHQGKFHIHFAINSINYKTGRKFHTSKFEKQQRENLFNQILLRYQMELNAPVTPIHFYCDYNKPAIS